jgi:streptogramin lyase
MDGVITMFTGPGVHDPRGIAVGPDGAMWFTSVYKRIGRITVDGTITTFGDKEQEISNTIGIIAGP